MVREADGTVRRLTASRQGPLLGLVPDARRTDDEAVLDVGTTLLLYTDGLVETRNRPVRAGLDELQDALARFGGKELDDLCDALLAELSAEEPEDDVALVAVRLHPQG